MRTIIFYGLSVVLWLSYFYAFFRLRRSSAPVRDRNPDGSPVAFLFALRLKRRCLKSLSLRAEFFAVPDLAQIRRDDQQKPNAD